MRGARKDRLQEVLHALDAGCDKRVADPAPLGEGGGNERAEEPEKARSSVAIVPTKKGSKLLLATKAYAAPSPRSALRKWPSLGHFSVRH
jgi:hypothetical protein